MKKILVILSMLLFVSCAMQSAENAFKNGDYVESVRITMDYINDKGFSNIKDKDQEVILDRFNQIQNIYKQRLSQDLDNVYKDYFDYSRILYIINKNDVIKNKISDYSLFSRHRDYFVKGLDKIKMLYSMYAGRDDKQSLLILSNNLESTTKFVLNSDLDYNGYNREVNEYLRTISDIYNALANIEERNRNLESARDYYLAAYNIYKKYSTNYNNNYNNYTRLDREIEYKKGKDATKTAVEKALSRDYVSAVKYFNEAISHYNKYPNDFARELDEVKFNLRKAEENVKYQLAEEYYTKASDIVLRARTKEDYKKASELFKKASSYVYNYRGSEELATKYYNMYKLQSGDNQQQQTPDYYPQTKNDYYPQTKNDYYPDQYPYYQQQIDNSEIYKNDRFVGRSNRDTRDVENYLNMALEKYGYGPYSVTYDEFIEYERKVDKKDSYGYSYNDKVTEYTITEYITLTPKANIRNTTRELFIMNPIKLQNVYKEYIYSNGQRRVKGKVYGKNTMLSLNKDIIDNRVKYEIERNLR